jgi:hypothetical protein
VNGSTGLGEVVSATNSLVGSVPGDQVSTNGVVVLTNGNYLVASTYWSFSQGAVTWGSGTTGVSGVVSAANSLVGSTFNDEVGSFGGGITVLTNGNYVVRSPNWDNGAIINAGQ